MRHLLITGANRGIGLAVLKRYLELGDVHCFATARNPDQAEALHTLQNSYSDHLTLIPLEVTDSQSIDAALQQVRATTDSLDVLINNAGIDPPGQTLDAITADVMLDVYAVNTVAPLMISKAFLPLLPRGAKLVHISTEMASLEDRTYGGNYAYCSSKAALNMMMRGLAADLSSRGIITVALDPGWVRTDMGGASARLSPQESAEGIVTVIANLEQSDSGRYLAYNGHEHRW